MVNVPIAYIGIFLEKWENKIVFFHLVYTEKYMLICLPLQER